VMTIRFECLGDCEINSFSRTRSCRSSITPKHTISRLAPRRISAASFR
jgi:hypothetical protein